MKKFTSIIAMITGVALLVLGIFLEEPSTRLNVSFLNMYVGGDAYNYIMEASLVAGKIAGIKAQKAIFISCGTMVFCTGLISFAYSLKEKSKAVVGEKNKQSYENGFSSLPYSESDEVEKISGKDKWKCAECGRVNADCIGTCACGNSKR